MELDGAAFKAFSITVCCECPLVLIFLLEQAIKMTAVCLVCSVHAELGAKGEPMFDLYVLGPATHQLHCPTLQ